MLHTKRRHATLTCSNLRALEELVGMYVAGLRHGNKRDSDGCKGDPQTPAPKISVTRRCHVQRFRRIRPLWSASVVVPLSEFTFGRVFFCAKRPRAARARASRRISPCEQHRDNFVSADPAVSISGFSEYVPKLSAHLCTASKCGMWFLSIV